MATTAVQLKPTVNLDYRPQGGTLRAFHESKDFIRVLIGPLGSGKTQACICELLYLIDNQSPDAHQKRRSRWVVARNTYRDLGTTTIKDWRAVTGGMRGCEFKNGNPPTWTANYRRPDGTTVEAEVLFEAFDVAADDKKARGKQLTGVWFNELKELNKANVDMLSSRVTRFPPKAEVPDAKFHIIADSNAPDRDHWVARMALELKPPGWWFGIQPGGIVKKGGVWVDNPSAENNQNLKSDYYSKQIAGKKESWVRQNLANEFVFHTDGEPVHPDFNEQLHVAEVELEPGIPIDIGIDFGRTPAAAIMQRQVSGAWVILHELTSVNTSAFKFGPILRDFVNDHYPYTATRFTGDPAGDDMAQTRDESPLDMLALAGIDCQPAPTNDFEERTTALDSLLTKMIGGKPAILVHPRCTTIIRGLAGAYQFKRVQVAGDDRFKNKPDKGPESHVCESIHYGLLGAGVGSRLFEDHWSSEMGGDDWTPDRSYFE